MATESSIASAFAAAAKGQSSFPVGQLATAARAAGASPSLAEVKRFGDKCGASVGAAAFKEFCMQTSHKDSEEDLLALFEAMDLQLTGKVKKKDIKKCLLTFGEPLTQQEADAVLDELFPEEEDIPYQVFIQKLLL
ncbi:myosin light chain TgMLC1, putative [Eimeria acervulina]|uniref:Calmodulin n=1 Tax=Eimeria acervulina TaxID=5801 RepID=U6G979_EIMAC|nr:myosin light chain TgMLC1, putative [Eimeria acervulina]CDI76816.1 myosin light chain TgMLC1, putative [Eimeria acervulina]